MIPWPQPRAENQTAPADTRRIPAVDVEPLMHPTQFSQPGPQFFQPQPQFQPQPAPQLAPPQNQLAPPVGPPQLGAPEIVPTAPIAMPQASGNRRIRIQRRSSVGVQAQWFPVPDRNEWVAVVSGGVNLLVEGLPDLGTLDVSTDRLVLWTSGADAPDLTGEAMQRNDQPLEIYMEGNIVFRQGDRVIYARSMYYNITFQYGVVLDAEMLTPVPAYGGLVRLKAEVLQQIDREHFMATGGAVTTSRLGVPKYWLQADQIAFQDLQQPLVDPFTGQMQVDPVTGQPVMDHKLLATANNLYVYLGGLPVFYWPVIATDLSQKSTYFIDRISIDNDKVFGFQIRTDWDLYQLLGWEDPPPGTDWTLAVDYLSERGLGLGTDFTYQFLDPTNPLLGHEGEFHAWGINDEGLDNLGRTLRHVPPEEDPRGRVFARHRSRWPSGLQLTGELGLISDRNFLNQYYEQEWDQEKDQTTGLELKYLDGVNSLALSADVQVNDFFTQTSWLPRLDHIWIGQSIFGDAVTWSGHSHLGYARLGTATRPLFPAQGDPPNWTYMPWEPQDPAGSQVPGNREGVRAGTRQELDLPLNAGPVEVTPYVLGDVTYWGEDVEGEEDTRLLGQVGVRTSLSMWNVDPTVCLPLLNVNGLAHKVTFSTELLYADSSKDLEDLPLYDPLDDDSQEYFRHRMLFTTFPGDPVVPLMFDERFYALRTGMQGDVTAYSMEIADDLLVAQLGVRQRWQTKRGLPGSERIIDWITLDMGASVYPDANDNFGEHIGLVNYDFRWHVGDRFAVLSDGFYDFFTDGLKVTTLGATITKPQVGTLYSGIRNAQGPIDSTVLQTSLTYRMSDKWLTTAGTAFDLGPAGNLGSSLSMTRIGESFLVTTGATYDASRGNFGVRLMVEPRFIASGKTVIAGEPLPPVGAFGLE